MFEFKMESPQRRNKLGYNRNKKSKDCLKRVSMRRDPSTSYDSWNSGYTSYDSMKTFLLSRVGKPVDKVFSEFNKLMKLHPKDKDIGEFFDRFFTYEEEKAKGYCWASGFYISNGILNYKQLSKCNRTRGNFKHIQWNERNIDKGNLKKLHHPDDVWFYTPESTGPISIGKLWITFRKNIMLLPTYAISESKFRDIHKYPKMWTEKDFLNMKDFTEVTIVGFNNISEVVYAVKITDIENYTKRKIK